MEEPLVSIIVPCYNCEHYIGRLLDSIFEQTYQNIQIITVDDESTDNTKTKIESYREKFIESGRTLTYHYQPNAGPGGAVNTGLTFIKGTYFLWIDSDDFLHKENLQKKVTLLEQLGKGYYCMSHGAFVNDNNLSMVTKIIKRESPLNSRNYFHNLLFLNDPSYQLIYGAGNTLVRTEDFIKICPTKSIYPSKHGQNFQLMLPISYSLSCAYIKEPLYTIVERTVSHSRTIRNFNENIERALGLLDIVVETIQRMSISVHIKREICSMAIDLYYKVVFEHCINRYHLPLFIKHFQKYTKIQQNKNSINKMIYNCLLYLFHRTIRLPYLILSKFIKKVR